MTVWGGNGIITEQGTRLDLPQALDRQVNAATNLSPTPAAHFGRGGLSQAAILRLQHGNKCWNTRLTSSNERGDDTVEGVVTVSGRGQQQSLEWRAMGQQWFSKTRDHLRDCRELDMAQNHARNVKLYVDP